VRFVESDAQTHPFRAGEFDAAFSRFGVMFFADPAAAFANVQRSLKPGGRLAFVCWRRPEENPIFTLPMRAAAPHLPAPPSSPDPTAPGPFAFADPDRVRGILAGAGFEGVRVTPHDVAVSSGDLDVALALSLRVGSLGRVLIEHPFLREGRRPVRAGGPRPARRSERRRAGRGGLGGDGRGGPWQLDIVRRAPLRLARTAGMRCRSILIIGSCGERA
jgi:SAM-dependent methyltransferase